MSQENVFRLFWQHVGREKHYVKIVSIINNNPSKLIPTRCAEEICSENDCFSFLQTTISWAWSRDLKSEILTWRGDEGQRLGCTRLWNSLWSISWHSGPIHLTPISTFVSRKFQLPQLMPEQFILRTKPPCYVTPTWIDDQRLPVKTRVEG